MKTGNQHICYMLYLHVHIAAIKIIGSPNFGCLYIKLWTKTRNCAIKQKPFDLFVKINHK